jgi:hypothetical protein
VHTGYFWLVVDGQTKLQLLHSVLDLSDVVGLSETGISVETQMLSTWRVNGFRGAAAVGTDGCATERNAAEGFMQQIADEVLELDEEGMSEEEIEQAFLEALGNPFKPPQGVYASRVVFQLFGKFAKCFVCIAHTRGMVIILWLTAPDAASIVGQATAIGNTMRQMISPAKFLRAGDATGIAELTDVECNRRFGEHLEARQKEVGAKFNPSTVEEMRRIFYQEHHAPINCELWRIWNEVKQALLDFDLSPEEKDRILLEKSEVLGKEFERLLLLRDWEVPKKGASRKAQCAFLTKAIAFVSSNPARWLNIYMIIMRILVLWYPMLDWANQVPRAARELHWAHYCRVQQGKLLEWRTAIEKLDGKIADFKLEKRRAKEPEAKAS